MPRLLALCLVLGLSLLATLALPPSLHPQATDVYINILASGAKKLNIAIPEFARPQGQDPQGFLRRLPEIIGSDLTFSGLFSVVSAPTPLPTAPDLLKKALADFQAAGAHAALQGSLTTQGEKVVAEVRLLDLTSAEPRLIVAKTYDARARDHRRMAHRIADEVVYQFTGERGVADTKIAYVSTISGTKELYMMDYDGHNVVRLTTNSSINLTPAWRPDGQALAFTSYQREYPYLFLLFPFEGRQELLQGWPGLNTAPAWAPDGQSLAYTLSKDGNPEIYVLRTKTGEIRRLTNHRTIDTDPTWSPTGREIAFTSDRGGTPQVYIMDAEGANVRRLTFEGGYNVQPRWSPRGDQIAYTSRQGNFDLWVINVDGSNLRRLTSGSDNESASWAPNGRHLVFASRRAGRWQLFTVQADGNEAHQLTRDRGEVTSPAWSPRIP